MLKNKLPSSLALTAALIFSFLSEAAADERYRVSKGDNLYRIGRKFGISYSKIMAANGLRNTTIYPNQILLIPSARPKPQPTPIATRVPSVEAPRQVAQAEPQNSYRSATVPNDPVEPFVSARKLPKAKPIQTEEDPLGLGYDPNRVQSPPETPIAQARPAAPPASYPQPQIRRIETPITPVEPQVAQAPRIRTFQRGREVPAAAEYPGRSTSSNRELNPFDFPTPSFENPCKPKPAKKKSVCSTSSKYYTVQSGDSMWSIGRKFGVAPLKIRASNGIMFSKIRPGMRLKIPESSNWWAR